MALSQGLFKSQEQTEQDLTDGPGWTIDQQKPSLFDNIAGAAPRGVGEGAAAGISVLTHGLKFAENQTPMESVMDGPAAAARATQGKTALEPWQQSWNEGAAERESETRAYAKTLTPDPRVTGTAANLVQGFSKAVTEFTAGSAAGGPVAGATLLGTAEGYGHYQDLLDQGVDPATARKSAILTGATSAAGAVMPMALPGKLLAGLSTTGTLLAQSAAGAAINTTFGAATRYASAKILADAGYPEQAEQNKPWDATNLATDALTGLFFGAHAGWHGLKADAVDPSIRDAAKVVQDRQEVTDRAPGVPVDMKSAAVHRELLESALGDLMSGKNVDSSHIDSDGATFARPEVDESQAHDIMREEFQKSGVLDDAAAFDRWLKGEKEPEPKEVAPEPQARKALEEQPSDGKIPWVKDADTEGLAKYPDVGELPMGKGTAANADSKIDWSKRIKPIDTGGEDVLAAHRQRVADTLAKGEEEGAPLPTAVLAERPHLQIVDENGGIKSATDEQAKATEAEAQANKEAEPMHQAAVECEARHL